jgi:hypothetical protein
MLSNLQSAIQRVHNEVRAKPADSKPAHGSPPPGTTAGADTKAPALQHDAALHAKLKEQPETREAVYRSLARTEPALIHHLETWHRQDEPAVVRVDAPAHTPRHPADLRDALGQPPTLRGPDDRFDNSLTPLPGAAPRERFDNSLTPLPKDRPSALQGWEAFQARVQAAVPVARTLIAEAAEMGAKLVQAMSAKAAAQADAAAEAAIDSAVKELQDERGPEFAAVRLPEMAAEIEAAHGHDAAVEFIARYAESDPAAFADGLLAAEYVASGQFEPIEPLLAEGLERAYERAGPGAADFSRQLIEGMWSGQSGAANTLLSQLVARSGNGQMQADFVTAGLEKAHELGTTDEFGLAGANTLVQSLAPAVGSSTVAVQAVIDTTSRLGMGTSSGDMQAPGSDSLNWVLNQFANANWDNASGRSVNGFEAVMAVAAPADAPPYPGAPFAVANKPLSSEQSLSLFTAISGDNRLLEWGDPAANPDGAGTALAARLFQNHGTDWINQGLIAGNEAGVLNDRFDAAFTNFMDRALFDPEFDGAYRTELREFMIGTVSDLSSQPPRVGTQLDAYARGQLAGALVGLVDKGFDHYAERERVSAEERKAFAEFGVGLAFALVPGVEEGSKALKILVSQGMGQSESVVNATVQRLIDAGVDEKVARAAADAANRGELVDAFSQLGLSSQAQERVAEYIDNQAQSLASGATSYGELLLQIFRDPAITPSERFREGFIAGWDLLQAR